MYLFFKFICAALPIVLTLHLCFVAVHQEGVHTKEDLGKMLFFDNILSRDSSISCASCHIPEFAFADTATFSKGVQSKLGTRNTPSVMNMAFRPYFFYDGRAASLEEQVIGPIENPLEMDLSYSSAVNRVKNNTSYSLLFNKIYHEAPDSANISHAIASFMRSLESDGSAPADLWINDVEGAMSESAIRGRDLFLEKGKCFDCHFGPDFTGDEFRNIGTYDGEKLNDPGRFEITKDSSDLGKFKVPGLRNVSLTAPYMHNGMFASLEEVIEFYDDPYQFVEEPINLDTLMISPLNLTAQEKIDLLNFLLALTDVTLPN